MNVFQQAALALGIVLLISYTALADDDLIESFTIDKNSLTVVVNKGFKKQYLRDDFFVTYDEDIDLKLLDTSLLLMPFVMNVVSIVWISGKTYHIDAMDKVLFERLRTIKKVFQVLYPQTKWDGELIPRRLVANDMPLKRDPEKEIALLFSGGLDSTVSSLCLADKKQLLITAWGQWDVPLHDEGVWHARKRAITDFAKVYGHHNAFLRSNYAEFFKWDYLHTLSPEIHHWRIDAVEGLGWAGLTAPILYLKGYRILYIASSETWDLEYPSLAIPYVDDNVAFSQIQLKHHMFNYNRFEKVQLLTQLRKKSARESLMIKGCCNRTAGNCLDCRRCCQTVAGFMLLGEKYQRYGYFGKRGPLIKQMKYRVKERTQDYEDRYNYLCLADYIKKQRKKGNTVPKDLAWLEKITFDLSTSDDVANQQKIDWEKLHSLFPEVRAQNMTRYPA